MRDTTAYNGRASFMLYKSSLRIHNHGSNEEPQWIDVRLAFEDDDLVCFHDLAEEPFRRVCIRKYEVTADGKDRITLSSADKDICLSMSMRASAIHVPQLELRFDVLDENTRDSIFHTMQHHLKRDAAAVIIQRAVSKMLCRTHFRRFVQFTIARAKSSRFFDIQKDKASAKLEIDGAVSLIQRAWRRHKVLQKWKALLSQKKEAVAEERKYNVELKPITFSQLVNDESPEMITYKKSKGKFLTMRKSTNGLSPLLERNKISVSSAKFQKLVEIMCRDYNTAESGYTTIMLNTLPHYTNPFEFFQMLRFIFISTLKETQTKVTDVLLRWVSLFPEDFINEELIKRIEAFLPYIDKLVGNQQGDRMRQGMLKSTLAGRSGARRAMTIVATKNIPPIIERVKDPKSIFDLDELEVARQLTLASSASWREVRLREFCNLAWEKRGKERKARNLIMFIERCNKISLWVCHLIMEKDSIQLSASMIAFWINVAEHCRSMGNFSDLVAIMTGLQHSSVSRLKKRWAAVSDKDIKLFNSLQEVVKMDSNYKNLRSITKKTPTPIVPFVGIWLHDLVFLEENPTFIQGRVSFEKLEMLNELFDKITRTWTDDYHFLFLGKYQELLWPEHVTEKQVYTRSLLLERRGA
ncbi:hypothetical protein PROFUN_09671 [Planoprotostelium fungivorum]|uniref:Uncharacterized protein n=1 Tax=Planoprotostelium fungivorum TaxID=1890364 RepID=A0A2P6NGJ5_9EUKA|nr:hypothetical protein PROFUN_09671 [Planoprotostelium fungivorum]